MAKYYVIKTTKSGIEYKKAKTLDIWSKDKSGCWEYSKQGAERIAERYNSRIAESNKYKIHYNTLEII